MVKRRKGKSLNPHSIAFKLIGIGLNFEWSPFTSFDQGVNGLLSMGTSKRLAKQVVLPHSQAKLDLYKNYLSLYLKVLTLTPYCNQINLFDIYCGIGLYDDGNLGSPLITNNTIRENNELMRMMNKPIKPVCLHINDIEKEKISKVKSLLDQQPNGNCNYNYYTEDGSDMLDIAISKVEASGKLEKNLIFIDPYGYSQIQREKIYKLLKNNKTEVLLFIPVMQMYRFKDIAISDPDRSCYEDLRNFIFSFFPEEHKIHEEGTENIFDFIYEIKKALGFGNEYLSCAHYIQRDKGNYYALFFSTSNMYGLEKMVEAKWKLDPVKGSGYTQEKTSIQLGMFAEELKERDHRLHLAFLKGLIMDSLNMGNRLSNTDLYSIALRNEFRPIDAKKVLTELFNERKIIASDSNDNALTSIDGGYMNYNHYKNSIKRIFYTKRR